MKARTKATVEDLYEIEGKAELVAGEVVSMSPTGGFPGFAGDVITASLLKYARDTRSGFPVGDNKAFVVHIPEARTFSPDVAYYSGKMGPGYYHGAPAFAVEVRSANDYGPRAEREIAQKRTDYFAAGTEIVWDVDVLRDGIIRSYKADSPETPTTFTRGETADAEPTLPGWRLPVDDLFYWGETEESS